MASDSSNETSDARVRVVVRVRPLLSREPPQPTVCVPEDGKGSVRIEGVSEDVCVDAAYGVRATTRGIFETEIAPHLPRCLRGGSNATIFAYGISGAGKTTTMDGDASRPGIIPLVVRWMVDAAARGEADGGVPTELSLSYLEIYNEKVHDLLVPPADAAAAMRRDLPLREDGAKRIVVPDATEARIASVADFEKAYALGCTNRSTGATNINAHSSRSHAVCILKIAVPDEADPSRCSVSKINLIDLAGSEDNRRTGNQAQRLRESGNINRSLFSLGRVVSALNRAEKNIPFRDSKLTRLLQDSLGGTARTVMIANVSPASPSLAETVATLKFAVKVKNINATAIRFDEALIQRKETAAPSMSMAQRLAEWKKKRTPPPAQNQNQNQQQNQQHRQQRQRGNASATATTARDILNAVRKGRRDGGLEAKRKRATADAGGDDDSDAQNDTHGSIDELLLNGVDVAGGGPTTDDAGAAGGNGKGGSPRGDAGPKLLPIDSPFFFAAPSDSTAVAGDARGAAASGSVASSSSSSTLMAVSGAPVTLPDGVGADGAAAGFIIRTTADLTRGELARASATECPQERCKMAKGYISSGKKAEAQGRLLEALRLYGVAFSLAPRSAWLRDRIALIEDRLNNGKENPEQPPAKRSRQENPDPTPRTPLANTTNVVGDSNSDSDGKGAESIKKRGVTAVPPTPHRRVLEVLNTADVKGLMELHGVGKKRASLIAAHREASGPLGSIDDLQSWGLTANFVASFTRQNCI